MTIQFFALIEHHPSAASGTLSDVSAAPSSALLKCNYVSNRKTKKRERGVHRGFADARVSDLRDCFGPSRLPTTRWNASRTAMI